MRRRAFPLLIVVSCATLAAGAGCLSGSSGKAVPPPDAAPRPPTVDIRADNNRDGVVNFDDQSDDLGEDTWDATHGAVFLANLDDDSKSCATKDASGRPLPDGDLSRCRDSADEIVNGDDDVKDLAPLRIKAWPDAPDDATVEIQLPAPGSFYVRLFRKTAQGQWVKLGPPVTPLGLEDLRAGVELGLEGLDITRDRAQWDGTVDVGVRVTAPGGYDGSGPIDQSDFVRLRVSPVMLYHHVSPVEVAYVSKIAGLSSSLAFAAAIRSVATAAAGAPVTQDIAEDDQWTEDFFETGYAAMPGPGGGQHVMQVNFRSANLFRGDNPQPEPRLAGRVVFNAFRGPDVGAIQQFDVVAQTDLARRRQMDTLNSTGNLETIPPYSHNGASFPLGRILFGSTERFFPDKTFTRMLEAQAVQGPPLLLDTAWLLVAHIDETLSFVKADTPRGWILLANDARLAKKMLEDEMARGNGDVKMFIGKRWFDSSAMTFPPAERTIAQVLNDATVMGESGRAAAQVDAQVALLKRETGLTDEEIVPVPFLHQATFGRSTAYQPGTVNVFVLNDKEIVAPEPHGPVIGGRDIMKAQLEDVLRPRGITVHWVEDWDLFHRLLGEIHCGTNARRKVPDARWWEVGR